jgi:mannose-1-phosphate guanylyltransferase
MKAFLLAAGEGTRLRPVTDNMPKCLVPINGKPLLAIWLELCERHGIDEVLVNLHWKVNAVRRFISESKWRLTVRLFEEAELLGSAGTVAANRSWVGEDACFWILYADVLTNVDLSKMLVSHRQHGRPVTMGLTPTDQPRRCGIALVDDRGLVVSFEEKPEEPQSNLAFSGVLVCSPEIYDCIPDRKPVDLGREVLPRLAGRMQGYLIREYLLDIGSLANYEAAQQAWRQITELRAVATASPGA